jgi:hypothetical protein
MAHSVFVSYSDPDRRCALEIVDRLEAAGFSVWVAPRNVSPSADWAAEIIDAITAARIMVLVFSSHSNTSPQVRREVERAGHKQVPVLPFRIEEVLPARSLEYFLSSQHWLDAFPPPLEPHIEQLCAHLNTLLNGPSHAAPPQQGSTRLEGSGTFAGIAGRLSLTAAEAQMLERALADQVGPVAKVLIKRAAARVADWDQLLCALGAEIESESARRRFLDNCRRSGQQRT